MIKTGIFVNKDVLFFKLDVIKNEIDKNIHILNGIENKYNLYANQESTSKSLDVLKDYSRNDINTILSDVRITLIEIGYKIDEVKQRYMDLCGDCSLDQADLEDNIEKVNRAIKMVNNVKESVSSYDMISDNDIYEYLSKLEKLKEDYTNKLDNLVEFDRYVRQIFDNEIYSLSSLKQKVIELRDKLVLSIENKTPNISFVSYDYTNTQINPENLDKLKEYEELIGTTYPEFIEINKIQYGFSEEEIAILWKLKCLIYKKYAKEGISEFLYNLYVGRIAYSNEDSMVQSLAWSLIVGGPSNEKSIKAMLKNIGLTDEEINKIYYGIRLQHVIDTVDLNTLDIEKIDDKDFGSGIQSMFMNYLKSCSYSQKEIRVIVSDIVKNKRNSNYANVWDNFLIFMKESKERYAGKIDFAHFSITTAVILQKHENAFSKIVEGYNSDNWDDEAGWHGDVFGISTIIGSVTPSIANDDYCSDLDAVNICILMEEKNYTHEQAKAEYYNLLNSGVINRAKYFNEKRPDVINHMIEVSFEHYYVDVYGGSDELLEKAREEFNKLGNIEKIEYLKTPEEYNFAYSLLTESNSYVEKR